MKKFCPRCGQSFDCRNDHILECWCLEEQLSVEVRAFLAENYQGCLCRTCILSIVEQIHQSYQLIAK